MADSGGNRSFWNPYPGKSWTPPGLSEGVLLDVAASSGAHHCRNGQLLLKDDWKVVL